MGRKTHREREREREGGREGEREKEREREGGINGEIWAWSYTKHTTFKYFYTRAIKHRP